MFKEVDHKVSAASCKVMRAGAWNPNSPFCCWAISLIHCMKGNLWIKNPIDFWNFPMSHRATVASLDLLLFLAGSLDVFGLSFSHLFPSLPSSFSVLASLLILALSPFSSSLCLGCTSSLPFIQLLVSLCYFFLDSNWFHFPPWQLQFQT